MPIPTLTQKQLDVLNASEADLEGALQSGFNKPDSSQAVLPLLGYSQSQAVGDPAVDYRQTVKAPFKATLACTLRHLDLLPDNWTEVSDGQLSNGWYYNSSGGGQYNTPGYYKDPFAVVRLKGALAGGSVGTVLILPLGYRPPKVNVFPIVGGGTLGSLTIYPTGEVQATGVVTGVFLDGISFRIV